MSFHREAAFFVAIFVANAAVQPSATDEPMRKVIDMLQAMQVKIDSEGKAEAKLYDEFMRYCKFSGASLDQSIADAQARIPQLESLIEELESEQKQLALEVQQHKSDREEASSSLAEASGARDKEAAAFATTSSELSANIDSLAKAIAALEANNAASFLQSSNAMVLGKLASTADLRDSDREIITSFLAGGGGMEEGSYGEVSGVLKQLQDSMTEDLTQAKATEAAAITEFDALRQGKEKEIATLDAVIQEKTKRIGEGSIELVNAQDDHSNAQKELQEDLKILGDLKKECSDKETEWKERSQLRAAELETISDTIKILNEDAAENLLKKTLPSPASFLQVLSKPTRTLPRHRAQQSAHKPSSAAIATADPKTNSFVALAVEPHVGIQKVMKMVDSMVALLSKEQSDDVEKQAYCEKELNGAEDLKLFLELAISDIQKVVENSKSALNTLNEEIASLQADIGNLDKAVEEATRLRKEENSEFQEARTSNNAAVGLIGIARQRLQQFYDSKAPNLLQAKTASNSPVTPGVSEGGTVGGVVSTGFVQASSKAGQAPSTWGAYEKNSDGNGVIAMLDKLAADLRKETAESEAGEKLAQTTYERFIEDGAERRASGQKLVVQKEGQKADAEAVIDKVTREEKGRRQEDQSNEMLIASLHKECDFLLQNFDIRRTARAGEVESLKQAKEVLALAGPQ